MEFFTFAPAPESIANAVIAKNSGKARTSAVGE
jgi:hypothetical protein